MGTIRGQVERKLEEVVGLEGGGRMAIARRVEEWLKSEDSSPLLNIRDHGFFAVVRRNGEFLEIIVTEAEFQMDEPSTDSLFPGPDIRPSILAAGTPPTRLTIPMADLLGE